MNKLLDADFSQVVKNAPLVAIDLLISNGNEILLGWRNNEPAKSTWFFPGGRIRKDESIAAAYKRIVQTELNLTVAVPVPAFVGVTEAIYDAAFDGSATRTHYVTLNYQLRLLELPTPDGQHLHFKWFRLEDALVTPEVHANVKRVLAQAHSAIFNPCGYTFPLLCPSIDTN